MSDVKHRQVLNDFNRIGSYLINDYVTNSIDVNEASADDITLQRFTLELHSQTFYDNHFLADYLGPHEFLTKDCHHSEAKHEYQVIIREHTSHFDGVRSLFEVLSVLNVSLKDGSQSFDYRFLTLT